MAIQILRGLAANLPTSAPVGQLLVTTDTNELYVGTGASITKLTSSSGGAINFNALLSGTNTTAAMVVGTGGSIATTGSGVINASEINGIPITGALTHAGQIPISQPGNASAVWADPLVQGIQAAGTAVSTVNPVLIAGSDGTDLRNLATNSSGQLQVIIAGGSSGNGAASNTGSAVPTEADYTGFNSGGNLVGVSTANPLPVAQQGSVAVTGTFWQTTQPVSGTVAISGSVAVTGTFWQTTQPVSLTSTTITGTVAVTGTFWQTTQPISGTVTANAGTGTFTTQDVSTVAQGSTTSGQSGALTQGATTTSAPVYTATKTNPLSLDTSGNLRTSVNNTVSVTGTFFQTTQPVSIAASVAVTGTFWQTTQPISGTVTANAGTITNTAPSSQNVTAQDTSSTTTTIANAGTFITGSPTAGSAASFALGSGFDTVSYQVTGTWTGTLVIESSIDGGTTWAVAGVHQQGSSYTTSTFTANFIGHNNVAGYTHVRVRATTSWTGTATVKIVQSLGPRVVYLANPIKLQDSTTNSISNTIKAASTAAQTTDTALVVAISPNNSVAVTGTITANSGTTTNVTPSTINITAQDTNSTTTAVANTGNFITGSPTANSSAVFALGSAFNSVAYQVTGTWTGTLVIEASIDGGTTWVSAGIHQQGTTYLASSFIANFIGEHNAAAYTHVRVRSTATWTGTATVKIVQTINPRIMYIANPIKIADATTQSVQTVVKPASTAALATDNALVVAISPNNTVSISGTTTQIPGTSGGLSTNVQQALTTSAQIKSSAGQLYGYRVFNPNAGTVYLFWYNTTSSPTIGSTTNLIDQIGIPTGAAADIEGDNGVAYSAGIWLAVSTAATSSSAPSTGLVITTKYK